MPINIAAMREQVRRVLGIDESDLDDAGVDLFLNESYWEILATYPFREKERTATFVTAAGTRNYDMPQPFEALRQLSIVDSFGRHSKLRQTSVPDAEDDYVDDVTSYGVPTAYVREGCLARLLPTPNDSYTIVIKYWTTLADLNDDNDLPEIPQEWHEIIKIGGIWRALMNFNGDIVRANAYIGVQAKLINEKVPVQAKEEIDTRDAGLEVKGLTRDY